MSRIGKMPVTIPAGVDLNISGAHVEVKGPKGSLTHELPELVSVRTEDGRALVERADDTREARALHGLTRALLQNMVTGVSDGFRKQLDIVGVGYRATAKGPTSLELQLGYSHPIAVEAPDGITFEVPAQNQIHVVGIDKQKVGQVAAEIRQLRKPEPYKGKGIKYAGERILRKAGKSGKR
jgi:large subunit ribosomal protein L6